MPKCTVPRGHPDRALFDAIDRLDRVGHLLQGADMAAGAVTAEFAEPLKAILAVAMEEVDDARDELDVYSCQPRGDSND
jgi:hypothetical protein